MAGPQGAEPLTVQCELADEFDEPGVVGVVPDGRAESGDEAGRGLVPVLVKGLLLGIEEEGEKPVLTGSQARGECDGHGIGIQNVEGAAFDERGNLQVGKELTHPCRHVLRSPAAPCPGTGCSQSEQIRLLDVVELQDARE